MPSRIVGKDARLYLDEFQLFLRLFEMEESFEVNTEESTVYSDNFKTFEPIDANGSFSLTGRMDDAGLASEQDATVSLDKAMFDNLFVDPVVATMLIEGASPVAGRQAHYAKLLHGSIALQLPRGGLGSLRLNGSTKERISDGFLLALADVSLSAGVDTFLPAGGINVGGGFTKGVHAVYHIWKRTGAGTLTIAIQGSVLTGGPYTNRLTFPTTTGVGAKAQEQAETTDTEVFQRVRLNSTTTETVSILVASRRFS